jgi:secreted PhoX family phosphatase
MPIFTKLWEEVMSRRNSLLVSVAVAALSHLPLSAGAESLSLVRIATMPEGAEVTGLSTNALGELFLNAQHPGGKNTFRDDAPPALVGYVAGFDPSNATGMDLPAQDMRSGVAVANGEYVTFAKAGDTLGDGNILGGVYDVSGALMYVSNTPDFNGFIPRGDGSAYLYTGWEGAGRDGASTVSRLALSKVDGKWQADLAQSKVLDLSPVYGGAVLCSGIVTPWGTPLMAEEYFFYNSALWNHPNNNDEDERASFQDGNDNTYIKSKSMSDYLGRMSNPYRYGYLIEVQDPTGAETLVKHYATGRLSHETAAIMPDNRTIYMTDDDSGAYADATYNSASGGVLFKFVADTAGDMSSGTLYAAKLVQDAETDPDKAGFDVTWVELGHGSNAEIETWAAEYDDVTTADYVEGQTSYISDDEVRAYAAGTANDARAAFLESRRTAAAMGATNEWDKLEGITSHSNTVYIAASGISYTMDKSWGHIDWSTGTKDETNSGAIALDAEGCGGTYRAVTGDDFNITRIDPYVVGQTTSDGSCDLNRPANPDNILALNDGTLLIGEDAGSKKHTLDMLWMVK